MVFGVRKRNGDFNHMFVMSSWQSCITACLSRFSVRGNKAAGRRGGAADAGPPGKWVLGGRMAHDPLSAGPVVRRQAWQCALRFPIVTADHADSFSRVMEKNSFVSPFLLRPGCLLLPASFGLLPFLLAEQT
jgi:hypothetical protein